MQKARRATVELCRLFLNNPEAVLSGGKASLQLSISRQGVWKAVQSLRDEGFSILALPQRGYILKELPANDLSPSLTGASCPPSCSFEGLVYFFSSLSSTQENAKELGRSSSASRLLVLADEQTRGRGRRDRSWVSPKGQGLFFSVFFRPRLSPGRLQLVNLAAGLAVRKAVAELHGVSLSLKWPNDLLWGDRKICGILSEASSDSEGVRDCTTGIGINITLPPEGAREEGQIKACALEPLAGTIHRGQLAAKICTYFLRLAEVLEEDGGTSLLEEYRRSCSTLGRQIFILTEDEAIAGRAEFIGENGELWISTDEELRSFYAADVGHATPVNKGHSGEGELKEPETC
ncbi:MAG: biotin--[acetyl-CoA-carboxylase] ligase [Synergistaceae bacterium]|nr:biotin--[acetyl-CoA-carboxylase] ligase [Synergistaceae bacterium]